MIKKTKTAMTSAEKTRAYRERMRALGYTQKIIWCTNDEHQYLLESLKTHRDLQGQAVLDLSE